MNRLSNPARAIPGYDPAKDKPLVVKVTGLAQWAWHYDYPDYAGVGIDSGPVRDDNGNPAGSPRLLEADNALVVPVGTVVRLHVISDAVIHSFAVPAFSVKMPVCQWANVFSPLVARRMRPARRG